MTKIINIHTGEVRKIETPKPPNCEICDVEVYEKEGGVSGEIGRLSVALCGVCVGGVVNMLVERQNKDK